MILLAKDCNLGEVFGPFTVCRANGVLVFENVLGGQCEAITRIFAVGRWFWVSTGHLGAWKEVQKQEKEKPDTVSFIRYVRPWNSNGIDNLQGVTFEFVLDYKERHILMRFVTCNGDNFSKAIAKKLLDNQSWIYLDMPEGGIPQEGTCEYIVKNYFNCFDIATQKQLRQVFYYLQEV